MNKKRFLYPTKYGRAVDHETIRAHLRNVDQQTEAQAQERLAEKTLAQPTVKLVGIKLAHLGWIIMMYGYSDPPVQGRFERRFHEAERFRWGPSENT